MFAGQALFSPIYAKPNKFLRFFAGECGDSRPHGEDCPPAPGQVFPCVNDREAFPAPARSDFLRLSRSRCSPPARAGDGLLGRAFPLSRPPARATRQLIVTPHRRSHQSSGTARPRADGKTSKGPDSKNSHRERPSFLPRNLSRPETRKITRVCSRQPVCSRPGVIRRNTPTLSEAPGAAGPTSISLPGEK